MTYFLISSSLIAALLLPNYSFAQYTKQADIEAQERSKNADEVNWYINRTFWIVPRPKVPIRFDFFETMPTAPFPSDKFFVDKSTSFTIVEKIPENENSTEYIFTTIFKIKFADGVEAFIRGRQLERSTNAILGHLSNGMGELSNIEYVYEEPPKKIKARIAAIPKKMGARIGMSANEVKASSWGKPNSINRTTTANGVREQWVYSGGYIYLTNGIVTAIQN